MGSFHTTRHGYTGNVELKLVAVVYLRKSERAGMYSELVVTPRGRDVLMLPPCGFTRQQMTDGGFPAQDRLVAPSPTLS
jgi:hypothetical protein